MNIWELCKCSGTQICPFCKILTVVILLLLSGVIGYFIGKKKGNKSTTK